MTSTQQFTFFATSMLAKSVRATAMSSCNGTNAQFHSLDQRSTPAKDAAYGSNQAFGTLLSHWALGR